MLRLKEAEVSEIANRLKAPAPLDRAAAALKGALGSVTGKSPEPPSGAARAGVGGGGAGAGSGRPQLDVHTWADLSPFASLARMIDLMTVFIKVVLVSIVLAGVMNVMVMAVYERIREIGTMAAIGTRPSRILSRFVAEGPLLGGHRHLAGNSARPGGDRGHQAVATALLVRPSSTSRAGSLRIRCWRTLCAPLRRAICDRTPCVATRRCASARTNLSTFSISRRRSR